MHADHEGAHYEQWRRKKYYSELAKLFPLIRECDDDCVPNFLAGHIGVFNRRVRDHYNFVAFKGSRPADFSVEIKIDPDDRELHRMKDRGWIVAPWTTREGYRCHLRMDLTAEDRTYLRSLIQGAYRDWRARQGR